jgi:hypothetical protein
MLSEINYIGNSLEYLHMVEGTQQQIDNKLYVLNTINMPEIVSFVYVERRSSQVQHITNYLLQMVCAVMYQQSKIACNGAIVPILIPLHRLLPCCIVPCIENELPKLDPNDYAKADHNGYIRNIENGQRREKGKQKEEKK